MKRHCKEIRATHRLLYRVRNQPSKKIVLNDFQLGMLVGCACNEALKVFNYVVNLITKEEKK